RLYDSQCVYGHPGVSSCDQYLHDALPIWSAEAGRVVTLTEGATTLGSATANAGGVWSFTPTLGDGVHTILASETDLAGNTGTARQTNTTHPNATADSESQATDSGDATSDQ